MDAAEAIHEKFVAKVEQGSLPRRTSDVRPDEVGLAREAMVELFYSQCVSRQMDRLSRRLQARGEGFYTIGSSGHENNAAVAEALRLDDMAFLHYRSAAFQIHRVEASCPARRRCWDMLLSFAASRRGPDLGRPAQGDRIEAAVHPAADQHHRLASAQGGRRGVQHRHRQDAEARGDRRCRAIRSCCAASATPRPTIRPRRARSTPPPGPPIRARPMPIVFLCEDNGIGISTRTPRGWIEATFREPAGPRLCALQRLRHGRRLARRARGGRLSPATRAQAGLPAHGLRAALRPCRLGRAGRPISPRRRSRQDEERDPLLYSAALLVEQGMLTGRRDPRHLRRDRGDARPDRRAGDRAAQADHQHGR